MQHHVNKIEDETRQVFTNATEQNFAALQYVQQHFSQLPLAHSSSDTPPTVKSHTQTKKLTPPPSAVTQNLPQTRSYTEVAAAVPVPTSRISPSPVPSTHGSTTQTSHCRKLHPVLREPKKIKQQQTSDIVFISDSIFKFLIEDKVALQYILQK